MAQREGRHHGYEYRDSVDTGIDEPQGGFETPDQTFRPERAAPTQLVLTRRGEFPVLEALVNVAGDELGELKKDADNRKAVEGAIDAGLGKGMDEIAKRKSFDDWVFGTRARKESAAKIKSSIGVNDYFSNQISSMNDHIETDPEQYITDQREILAKQHAQIEAAHGRDVADAFMAQAVQRLEQLVQMQVSKHHEWVQQIAASDFQKDILARAGVITQLYSEPGMEMQADADLQNLFDIENRPADMTPEAWHNNIAQAIMYDVSVNGSRRLYEYAEQMGVLDDMPQQIRDKLDNDYQRVAPTNNLEFIAADEALKRAIIDPSVSLEEFIEQQKAYLTDWDMVQSYSDEELANQRIRKQKSLLSAQGDSADLNLATQYYLDGNNVALSTFPPKVREAAASNALVQIASGSLNEEDKQTFLNMPEHIQRQYMYGIYKQRPELLSTVVEKSARAGYISKEMKHIFNDGVQALVFEGNPNPKAIETLELQRSYMATQPEFISGAVKDTALLTKYDNLVSNGFSPEEAVIAIEEGRRNPVSPKTYSYDDRMSARDSGLTEFERTLGKKAWFGLSRKELDNRGEISEELHLLADSFMEMGYNPEEAYSAAAKKLSGKYERVGNTAIRKPEGQSLATLAGLDSNGNMNFEQATERYVRDLSKGRIEGAQLPRGWDWHNKSSLDDYMIHYDEGQNRLFLTPKEPLPVVDSKGDIVDVNKQIGIPLREIGERANKRTAKQEQAEVDKEEKRIQKLIAKQESSTGRRQQLQNTAQGMQRGLPRNAFRAPDPVPTTIADSIDEEQIDQEPST